MCYLSGVQHFDTFQCICLEYITIEGGHQHYQTCTSKNTEAELEVVAKKNRAKNKAHRKKMRLHTGGVDLYPKCSQDGH